MLLELEVENFKSIESGLFKFGPMTALQGTAAAGKSTLMDAVALLGELARSPINKACTERARSRTGCSLPVLSMFSGCDHDREIAFRAKMLVDPLTPRERPAVAVVCYELRLRYREESGMVALSHESLEMASREEAEDLLAAASGGELSTLMSSALKGTRRHGGALVGTGNGEVSWLGGSGDKPMATLADTPRTVVGHHHRYPPVAAAGDEMRSWRRLDPSFGAMMRPRMLVSPGEMGGLTERGENAASLFLRHMEDHEAADQVIAALQSSDPRIHGLTVDRSSSGEMMLMANIGGRLAPAADIMSSATGQLFAWLLMQHDREWAGTLCVDDRQAPVHGYMDRERIEQAMLGCLPDPSTPIAPQNRPRQVICMEAFSTGGPGTTVVRLPTPCPG